MIETKIHPFTREYNRLLEEELQGLHLSEADRARFLHIERTTAEMEARNESFEPWTPDDSKRYHALLDELDGLRRKGRAKQRTFQRLMPGVPS